MVIDEFKLNLALLKEEYKLEEGRKETSEVCFIREVCLLIATVIPLELRGDREGAISASSLISSSVVLA